MPRPPTKHKRGKPRKARAREQHLTQQVEEEVYKWSNDPKELERFVFTEKSGVILKMADGATPEDFFQIFLIDKILDLMMTTINEHATDIMNRSRPSRHKSRHESFSSITSQITKESFSSITSQITNEHYYYYYWFIYSRCNKKRIKIYKENPFANSSIVANQNRVLADVDRQILSK